MLNAAQIIIGGLLQGGVFALVALGFSLVFRVSLSLFFSTSREIELHVVLSLHVSVSVTMALVFSAFQLFAFVRRPAEEEPDRLAHRRKAVAGVAGRAVRRHRHFDAHRRIRRLADQPDATRIR